MNQHDLTEWERDVIGLLVLASDALGFPRSVGEIYGLIFAESEPISFAEITRRLRISKGSASQGIRFLRGIGAIRPTYKPGSRKALYAPELELRVLLAGLLRERLLPYLDQGGQLLTQLQSRSQKQHADADHMQSRIAKLQSWHQQSNSLLPLLSQLLD